MSLNFNFGMPTNFYFGLDCIKNNIESLKIGFHALIVTGKNSSKINGSFYDITKALENCNIRYTIFDEIEENPSFQTIEKGRQIGLKNNIDFIICIGGGSPLDAGKAISLFIKNETIDQFNYSTKENLDYLPIIAIPTTAGTGSEVTPHSIITDNIKKTKVNLGHKIYPKIAFVDSKYTYNLPKDITINTTLDAFCHLIEGYLNNNANDFTDLIANLAFDIMGKNLYNLVDFNFTEEFRDDIMYVSMLAGLVISQTGTSIPHGLSYPLTYFKKIPHGLACAITTTEYLKTFDDKSKINIMLNKLNISNIDELSKIFNSLIKIETSFSDVELEEYANDFFENKSKLKNHPENISLVQISNILFNSINK